MHTSEGELPIDSIKARNEKGIFLTLEEGHGNALGVQCIKQSQDNKVAANELIFPMNVNQGTVALPNRKRQAKQARHRKS